MKDISFLIPPKEFFKAPESIEYRPGLYFQAPGCIVSCVGGGGLVLGLLQGLDKAGWSSTPVLAMETEGAHCFAAARQAGQVVQLAGITSVATSLGALSVSETLFNLSVEKVGYFYFKNNIHGCL